MRHALAVRAARRGLGRFGAAWKLARPYRVGWVLKLGPLTIHIACGRGRTWGEAVAAAGIKRPPRRRRLAVMIEEPASAVQVGRGATARARIAQ